MGAALSRTIMRVIIMARSIITLTIPYFFFNVKKSLVSKPFIVIPPLHKMEQSSSYDETTVRHQFDRKCKLALDGEVVDYDRHMDYRRKHEILFSELSECQTGKLSVVDEYNETSYFFKTCEYDVKVKSSLLAEALNALTDRKREVILLSYFMEMSDAAIAR